VVKLAVGADEHLAPTALGQVFVTEVADTLVADLVCLAGARFAGALHGVSIHPNALLLSTPPPKPVATGGVTFEQPYFIWLLLFTLHREV